MKGSPRRRNVTTSMVGLKTVTYAKISPKMVNPRDIDGNAEEEGEREMADASLCLYSYFERRPTADEFCGV